MQLLGKRWTGLVLSMLMSGPRRFSEMESALPISGRLLSERLKELEAAGVVTRTVLPEQPVRVQYALTAKGRAMEPVITAVQRWADEWE